MNATSTRRLFFALWPSAEEQRALAVNFRGVVQASGGREVAAANLHATLAFLGSVSEDSLPLVHTIALKVSDATRSSREPITLNFDSVDHWRKPQIICATATTTPPAAIALADALKNELTDAGFTPDLKAFRAHITLARKVREVDANLLLQAPSLVLTFRDFSLVESRTASSGSSYSVIANWPLCMC